MTHSGRKAAAFSLLLAGAVACKEDVEEDRGPVLTAADYMASLPTWSADGTEIYFVKLGDSGNGFQAEVDAVSMTGNVRGVDQGKGAYWSLRTAADGTLYYTASAVDDQASRQLFSTAATGPLPVDFAPGYGDVLAVSPDGGRIAYFGQDDTSPGTPGYGLLKLFTFADASVVTLADSRPVARYSTGNELTYSPSSNQLLYVTTLPDSIAGGLLIDVATGAAATKTWDSNWSMPLVHWDETGLRIAAAPHGQYAVLNLDTGALVPLPAASSSEPWTGSEWSPDGSRIAYWTSSCLEACSVFACCADKWQYELFIVDVATGQVARVAATGVGGSQAAFSPDSSRIAYVIDGRIHVRDVR